MTRTLAVSASRPHSEVGMLLLQRLVGIRGPDVCGSFRLPFGGLGLEKTFEAGVLVGEVSAFDIGFDGRLGHVQPPVRPLRGAGEQPIQRCGLRLLADGRR
ncbi:hypothetical protein [Streptomyces canus]|uniref:hypothetical protein n=1 Tax=Streptomyces canus TaxID=58343 RepID=UPI00371D12AF